MMKKTLLYVAAAALLGNAVLSSCDDNFTYPPVVLPPTANVTPTTTLADFKANYWSALTSPTEVPYGEQGDTIIFTGRVCSTDETGNIYKSIIVQSTNEAGEQVAINFSVNDYDLYELFPFGQEVAVYASGLSVGGYRNLLQFGAVSGSEMTFMDVDLFKAHVIRNNSALPEPEKVDTTIATIPEIVAAKADKAQLQLWQSRLIRIDSVRWEDAGQPYAGSATVNRYIVDNEGNRIVVRNSSYATFKNAILPHGTGSVTGILSYFSSDWQILLNDTTGVQGFDNIPTETPGEDGGNEGEGGSTVVAPAGDGTAENPYNVAKAFEVASALNSEGKQAAYTKGIVASIKEFSSQYNSMTYYIKDTEGTVTLYVYGGKGLNGVDFTSADQLNVGDEVIISGDLVNYKGNTPQYTTGSKIVSINGNGATETPDTPTPDVPGDGEGTQDSPYSVAQVVAKNPTDKDNALESGVWVKGYIVGSMPTGGTSTLLSNTSFGIADAAATNLVLGPTPDCKDASKCVGVQLPSSLRSALALANKPENLGKQLAIKGDIMKYCGGPGLKNGSEYVLEGADEAPTTYDYLCSKVTEITSGEKYVLVIDGQYGEAIGKAESYGRLNLIDPVAQGDKIGVAAANLILIEKTDKGYTLKDTYNRYLAMDASYKTSFQLYTSLNDGCYWAAEFVDGKLKLTNNVATTCFVSVSKGSAGTFYTNIAPADSPAEYKLPELYIVSK